MLRAQNRPVQVPSERDKVIYVCGIVSALFAVILLLLAYAPS